MDEGTGSRDGMEDVFKIVEAKIRGHVNQVVRESVEETLSALLDAEADALCHAKRCEHSVERADTHAIHHRASRLAPSPSTRARCCTPTPTHRPAARAELIATAS